MAVTIEYTVQGNLETSDWICL